MQPNLYILGFPKSGTSTLFQALVECDDVVASNPKETFYLSDEDTPFYKEHSYLNYGDEGWSAFFKINESRSAKYIVEATTHNIYQNVAREAIKKQNSNVKLIVLLRNPAERIWSSFTYTKHNFGNIDKGISFSRFVNDLFENNEMSYINHPWSRYVLPKELVNSDYYHHLEKWKAFFLSKQMYVATFEEMKYSPKTFYSKILKWLELEMDLDELIHVKKNSTFMPKNRFVHKVLVHLNRVLNGVPILNVLKRSYVNNFTTTIKKSPEDKLAMGRLRTHFKGGNQLLRSEYGVDITGW